MVEAQGDQVLRAWLLRVGDYDEPQPDDPGIFIFATAFKNISHALANPPISVTLYTAFGNAN